MTVGYKAVGWNRQKRVYDLVLLAGVALYLAGFLAAGMVSRPGATVETLLIRAFGTGAVLLLHIILCIGPASRLDRRFLPLLYNRRHLGVTMFVLALAHAAVATIQFHAFQTTNPVLSILTSNTRFDSLAQFPFHPLGLAALLILFMMAATSHDFWLTNLTAPTWKRLHMLVYAAYALLIGHIVLGVLQGETNPLLAVTLGIGLACVLGLHLAAAWREKQSDRIAEATTREGLVDVCAVDEIGEKRARIVTLSGDRVAVFRYDGTISALSNACQHQNGPLGEGRIVNGCVVCPWHGYEYRPESGQSPPPFTEKVPTFRTLVAGGRVLVDPRPNPPGTPVEPATIDEPVGAGPRDGDFYVGYKPDAPVGLRPFLRLTVAGLYGVALTLALLLAEGQAPFAASTFEFGNPRPLEGLLHADPYPTLLFRRPGDAATAPVSRYLLVGQGKNGAGEEVAGLEGEAARLEGTLIYRDGQTMIEVVPGSTAAAPAQASSPPRVETLGRHTLRGEIIDGKCYLGVMKPGRGKAHRACAVACIRGGVPPLFLVTDASGHTERLVLVDTAGLAVNDRVLKFVGEPLEIAGEVVRRDNLLYLLAEPETFRRI